MARIAIVTDSSSDLTPDMRAGGRITVVPAPFVAARSSVATPRDVAEQLTTPPSALVDMFAQTFTELASDHDAIVAVLLSSRLGGIVDAALQAREQLAKVMPVEVVDSRSASLGLGFQVMRGAELAHQGMSAVEIAAALRAAIDRYHVVFSVERVEHLRESGQIGRSAAMIAEALQLKPLLRIDEGQIIPYERARTRQRAIHELADFVCELPAVERCAVLYATNETDADRLYRIIAGFTGLPSHRLTMHQIGPAVATQVGPGALGVAVVETDAAWGAGFPGSPPSCARLATAPALENTLVGSKSRVNQDRSLIANHAEMTTLAPGDARSRLEMAVELLRREWRDGCPAGMAYRTALGSVRRLRPAAASEQIADDLSRVIDDLDAYTTLPAERRPAALTEIAAAIKRLIPEVARIEAPARPMNVMDSARRPPRKSSEKPRVESARDASQPSPTVAKPRLTLDDPVTALKGAGGATSKKLARLGVQTIGDLLHLAPRRHIDYSRTIRIGEALNLRPGSDVTVRGRVTDVQLHRGPGAPRVTIKLADVSGWVRVTWFNQYLASVLHVGDEIAVSGALESGYGPLSFTGPEWERVSPGPRGGVSTGRIVPVYPLTAGLAQKSMRGFSRQALDLALGSVEEYLPEEVRLSAEGALPPLRDAIAQVHYPDDEPSLQAAKERLAFDDLFLLQLGLVLRKRERKAYDGIPIQPDEMLLRRWAESLPFRLTGTQQSVLAEILEDMSQQKPMARLLQGDVGSGKTAVAAAAMLATTASGLQSALMAPTEILAEQHVQGLGMLYARLAVGERPRVRLLTGSTRATDRRQILEAASAGEIDILIGTHALIQDGIDLPRLALTVVDEQHRFGVRQRAALPGRAEGRLPHQLAMTATPIPRTLNLVIHGDLDVSVLTHRPPGRIPIETRRYIGAEREAAYALVREEVAKGHQVFVICPLVEASDAVEAKAAVEEAERLSEEVFPELRIATLHGRMKSRDKDAVMSDFRDRRYDVLVSTSVIEVGIDVPNATVMLIEGADRFGLAQLHQFRGRVGRGGALSYCLLLAEEGSPDGEQRLETMVASDDGFLLAEKDLELRGPGDFIGTRQSGLPEMQWLDGVFDTRLLDRARRAAEALLAADPDLTSPDHHPLSRRFDDFWERAAPEKAV